MVRATFAATPVLPRAGARAVFLALSFGVLACAQPGARDDSGGPLRLVDLFPEATVEGTPTALEPPPPVQWSFDAEADASAWTAVVGGGNLARADAALRGTTAPPATILSVDWKPADPTDSIYSIEVRMRASRPTNLLATFDSSEAIVLPALLGNPFAWQMRSPVLAGETQTYELRPSLPVRLDGVKRLLLRPGDSPGVEYAVESVRVITRKSHLLAVPPGIGWQGAREIYRETIASRSPERVRFTLDLPSRPRLDLALATLEPGAGTFTVEVTAAGRDPLAVSRTVSEQLSWQPFSVDLSRFAGARAELTLALSGPRDGFLGLWGTPVVRQTAASGGARPRGVILVIADTLRRDHLDLYGYERDTAPNIAKLASEGGNVLDALSQGTWTKVSVPAIQTGLYPSTHSIVDLPDLLPATATTLAEAFREAGYATVGFASIPFVGRFTNLHQGYEEFHEPSSLQASQNNKSAREFMGRLLPWLERNRDVPFFALFHVADPHSPYFADEPYDELWGDPGTAAAHRAALEQVRPHIAHPLMKNFGMALRSEIVAAGVDPEQFVERELDAYDGSIRGLDVEIGRLLEQLDYLGLRDEVVIAFVSDHGTEFLDHDAHFHGHSAYGELNRVPMFFWGPRFVPAGIDVPGTLQTIDLAPTLLELAGLPKVAAMQGRSLAPFLRAGASVPEPLPAFTEKALVPSTQAQGLPGRNYTSYAVVSDGWKLIWNQEPPAGVAEYELFDHAADPLNMTDVAAEHQDQVSRLRGVLEGWREAALAVRLDPASTEGMSAEELERLRALGYVQ